MKLLLSMLLLIVASTCNNNTQDPNAETNVAVSDQAASPQQDGILVGKISMDDLRKGSNALWFEPTYTSYKPDAAALELIKNNINEYEIVLFMGTWCPDSHYQVPHFYKLLEESDFDMKNLVVYAVEEDKTMPSGKQKEYDVLYVPTIIFYKDGKETGRFVEYPKEELEIDLAKIVTGQPYTPAYQ